MASIPEHVKVYIVTSLACFDSQKQIVADVKERFGLTLSHQHVSAYDPDTINGKRLSEALKELFADTREKFLKDATGIPIANASYRLRVLDRMARKAAEAGNAKMAAALIEQAAKEVGGQFTNRREHSGPRGGPIPVATTPLTPELRDELVSRTLAEF